MKIFITKREEKIFESIESIGLFNIISIDFNFDKHLSIVITILDKCLTEIVRMLVFEAFGLKCDETNETNSFW